MNINDDAGTPNQEGGYGGQKDTRSFKPRQQRPPREERPPRQEIDPDTNFKKYYERDQKFYLTILKEEEPGEHGNEFKLQLFKDGNYQPAEDSAIRAFGLAEFDAYIASELFDYDVVNFKSQNHFPGETFDKHRILFTIKDKEKAIKFWEEYIIYKKKFFEGARHQVYLQKPPEIFIRYGDQEAEKYYANLEKQRKEAEE